MEEQNKKPNIKALAYIVGGLLIFFLGFIAINEFTLQTGKDIYLKTMPVDPRDPLRGDYVILRYDFERSDVLREYTSSNNTQDGDKLYLSFSKDQDDLGTLSSVSESKPDDGIFLQITWKGWNSETGIGKYFVPEGTGRVIERVRSDVLVHAKIDSFGVAKIVDLYYKGEKINPDTFTIK